jgi:hypothetical protein
MWSLLFRKQLIVKSANFKKIYYTLSYVFTSLIFVVVVTCYNQLIHEPTDIIDIVSH